MKIKKKKNLNVKNQKTRTTTKAKQTIKKNKKKTPKRNSQRQKKHKKETLSIFPKDFSHVFYLFPYQKLLRIIHLRY